MARLAIDGAAGGRAGEPLGDQNYEVARVE